MTASARAPTVPSLVGISFAAELRYQYAAPLILSDATASATSAIPMTDHATRGRAMTNKKVTTHNGAASKPVVLVAMLSKVAPMSAMARRKVKPRTKMRATHTKNSVNVAVTPTSSLTAVIRSTKLGINAIKSGTNQRSGLPSCVSSRTSCAAKTIVSR